MTFLVKFYKNDPNRGNATGTNLVFLKTQFLFIGLFPEILAKLSRSLRWLVFATTVCPNVFSRTKVCPFILSRTNEVGHWHSKWNWEDKRWTRTRTQRRNTSFWVSSGVSRVVTNIYQWIDNSATIFDRFVNVKS